MDNGFLTSRRCPTSCLENSTKLLSKKGCGDFETTPSRFQDGEDAANFPMCQGRGDIVVNNLELPPPASKGGYTGGDSSGINQIAFLDQLLVGMSG
jgi:hypothetical protein